MTEKDLKENYEEYLRQEKRKFDNSMFAYVTIIGLLFLGYFLVTSIGWLYGLIITFVVYFIIVMFTWYPYKALKIMSYEKWSKEYLIRQDLMNRQK
jgi:amino acid permease